MPVDKNTKKQSTRADCFLVRKLRIISGTDIGKYLQNQIADQNIHNQGDQCGKINHETAQFQIRQNSGKWAHQSRRNAINPSHERRAGIDREKFEDEAER